MLEGVRENVATGFVVNHSSYAPRLPHEERAGRLISGSALPGRDQWKAPDPRNGLSERLASWPVAASEADSSPEPGMESVRRPGFLVPVRAISGHQ